MTEITLLLIGNLVTFGMGLFGVIYAFRTGFKAGRQTVNQAPIIENDKEDFDETSRDVLNSPDMFTEALNEEGIDDPNSRLNTL
jgi:hypothetical protein